MECPIEYSSEQVAEAINEGGLSLNRLTNKISKVLMNDQDFKNAAYGEVLNNGGNQEDAKDMLNESLATYLAKIREGEMRILPGELIPYFGFQACMKRLKDTFSRKARFRLRGRSPIALPMDSAEFIRQLTGSPAEREKLVAYLIEQLRASEEFTAEVNDNVENFLERIRQEQDEEKEENPDLEHEPLPELAALQEEVLEFGYKVLAQDLLKDRYDFRPAHLIPSYILGIIHFKWKNMRRQKMKEDFGLPPQTNEPEEPVDEEFQDKEIYIQNLNPAVELIAAPGDFHNPDEQIIKRENYQLILETMNRQPGDCPEILRMKALGYSAADIAEELGLATQTIHNKMGPCKDRFDDDLRRQGLR